MKVFKNINKYFRRIIAPKFSTQIKRAYEDGSGKLYHIKKDYPSVFREHVEGHREQYLSCYSQYQDVIDERSYSENYDRFIREVGIPFSTKLYEKDKFIENLELRLFIDKDGLFKLKGNNIPPQLIESLDRENDLKIQWRQESKAPIGK